MRALRSARSGFALLATLWVLTALTVFAGAGIAVARTGSQVTRNRILLARAGWAREACVEILLARFTEDPAVREVPVVDLGRSTWCRAKLEDPGAKLNVNEADSGEIETLLSAVGCRPSVVASIVAYLRANTIADLAQLPGVDSLLAARLAPLMTTRGRGTVNVNAAPAEVLRSLPGLGEEAVRVILGRRALGQRLQSADELLGLMSPAARTLLLGEYVEFLRATTFAPAQLVAVVEGGVGGTPITARATLTVVPVPGRLAVIRRETQ